MNNEQGQASDLSLLIVFSEAHVMIEESLAQ